MRLLFGMEIKGRISVVMLMLSLLVVLPATAEDAQSLTSRGYEYYSQNNYTQALPLFVRVVKNYSDQFEGELALFYQGRCLEELGRPAEARTVYLAVQERYPHSYLSSKAERRLQRLAGVEAIPVNLPEPEPTPPPRPPVTPEPAPPKPAETVSAPTGQDRHIVRRGETISGLALKYYGELRFWPALAYFNRLGNPERIAVGQSLEIPNKAAIQGLQAKAVAHYQAGSSFTDATDAVSEATPAEPEPTAPPILAVSNVPVEVSPPLGDLLARGRLAIISGEYIVAEGMLKQFLLQNPTRALAEEATLYLAQISFLQGDFSTAAQYYQQVVMVNPGSEWWPMAMFQLASLQLFQLGNPAAAQGTIDALMAAPVVVGQEQLYARAANFQQFCQANCEPEEREIISGLVDDERENPSPDSLMINVVEAAPAIRVDDVPVVVEERKKPRGQSTASQEDDTILPPEIPVAVPLTHDPLPNEVVATSNLDEAQTMAVEGLMREALSLKSKGLESAAEQKYREVLELAPDYTEAQNNLAFLYAEMGVNLTEAERLVRRAMEVDALRTGFYMDTLGWILYKQGDMVRAQAALDKAVAYRNTAARHYHLGMVLHAQEKYDQAIGEFMEAIQLGPDSEDARLAAGMLEKISRISDTDNGE